MPREKESYRDILVDINARHAGKPVLTLEEACNYVGIHRQTALRDPAFPAKKIMGKYIVPVPSLARYLA